MVRPTTIATLPPTTSSSTTQTQWIHLPTDLCQACACSLRPWARYSLPASPSTPSTASKTSTNHPSATSFSTSSILQFSTTSCLPTPPPVLRRDAHRLWDAEEIKRWVKATMRLAKDAVSQELAANSNRQRCLQVRGNVILQRWKAARPFIPPSLHNGLHEILMEALS